MGHMLWITRFSLYLLTLLFSICLVGVPTVVVAASTYRGSRIVGGTAVEASEYPWIVSLHYRDERCQYATAHFCTGSLLEKNWDGLSFVLTAAHCVEDWEEEADRINKEIRDRDGVNCDVRLFADISRDDVDNRKDKDFIRIQIDQVYCHEEFGGSSYENDVCLVYSLDSVTVSDDNSNSKNDLINSIIEINLQSDPDDCCEVNDELRVLGYGHDEYEGDPTDTLEYADVFYVSTTSCRLQYGSAGVGNSVIKPGMMCAYASGKDPCQGDSGGPLLFGTTKESIQVGIVSFGYKCNEEIPAVYARISDYYDWIYDTRDGINASEVERIPYRSNRGYRIHLHSLFLFIALSLMFLV